MMTAVCYGLQLETNADIVVVSSHPVLPDCATRSHFEAVKILSIKIIWWLISLDYLDQEWAKTCDKMLDYL